MLRGAEQSRKGAPTGARRSCGSARATTSIRSRIRARTAQTRLAVPAESVESDAQLTGIADSPDAQQAPDPLTSSQMQNETFSDADLAYELGEITRAANRANTTIYTIDPRGLVAGQDIDEQVDPQEWNELRAQVAGQHARARRGDRRHRRRQPERLRQGAEADRRRVERLLHARATTRATPTRRSGGGRSR